MHSKLPFSELLIGIALFIITLILMILFKGYYHWAIVYPLNLFNWIGSFLFIDFFVRKVIKTSFSPFSLKGALLLIIPVALLMGFLQDFLGPVLTGLWAYPYFPPQIYIFLAPPGYIFYFIILLSLYILIKAILGDANERNKINENTYKKILWVELFLGLILLLITIEHIVSLMQTLPPTFWDISKPKLTGVTWWYTFAAQLSLFFIFEYITFIFKKTTLTKKIMGLQFQPIIAILLASGSAFIATELVNAPFGVWVFKNWPHNEIQFLTVPLVVMLTWPFQFLVLLSLLRLLLSEKDLKIW
jgi:hypothetical protein